MMQLLLIGSVPMAGGKDGGDGMAASDGSEKTIDAGLEAISRPK
jgi:hypothetical protein